MKQIMYSEQEKKNVLDALLKRSPVHYGEYESVVSDILASIRREGDAALFSYTAKFDRCVLTKDTLLVTEQEIQEAFTKVDDEYLRILNTAITNIDSYHRKQLRYSWFDTQDHGIILGQKISPLDRVGVYVPGGKAAYPSTTLMNVVTAKVAGVRDIIMATPPDASGKVNPVILVAASLAGVNKIYKMGGAQAIAAMAYGTESVPKVDKIVGPGNIYVALAKKAVYGYVSIDSVAGPSEILVLADETANPSYIAADLLSQAEHDELASAILITNSKKLAEKVQNCLVEQIPLLARREIVEKSLEQYGFIIITEGMQDAIDVANEIASEHLEILTVNPWETMTGIRHAGAIFLGEYTCEALGDYYAGPNHVLPTNQTAKFFSPLGVDDFIKKSSVISYSQEALQSVYHDIATFADSEGLGAHANAVRIRFEQK